MTKIEANVPDFLAKRARALADREKVSIDQIVALALSAQLAVWNNGDDIHVRAGRADKSSFDDIMARVPRVPPLAGDELPEGYEPPG